MLYHILYELLFPLNREWPPLRVLNVFQYITFRTEYNHREANVPYFSGRGGVTPPGGNQGAPGSVVQGWSPDLVRSEDRLLGAILVKF